MYKFMKTFDVIIMMFEEETVIGGNYVVDVVIDFKP